MLVYYTMVTEGEKNMEWVKGLQKAINYIEDHITEDIDYAEIAKQALFFQFPSPEGFPYYLRLFYWRVYPQQEIVAGRNGFIVWK